MEARLWLELAASVERSSAPLEVFRHPARAILPSFAPLLVSLDLRAEKLSTESVGAEDLLVLKYLRLKEKHCSSSGAAVVRRGKSHGKYSGFGNPWTPKRVLQVGSGANQANQHRLVASGARSLAPALRRSDTFALKPRLRPCACRPG